MHFSWCFCLGICSVFFYLSARFFSFLKSHWAIEHGMWCSGNKKTQHMMPSRFPLYRERSLHLFITRIDLRTISTLCCWCCCSHFVFLLLSRCFLSIQHECIRTVNYFKKNWSGKYLISFNSCIQYSCNKFYVHIYFCFIEWSFLNERHKIEAKKIWNCKIKGCQKCDKVNREEMKTLQFDWSEFLFRLHKSLIKAIIITSVRFCNLPFW